jgi:hypothetical protein
MVRQKTPSEETLDNGNLMARQSSLIIWQSEKPIPTLPQATEIEKEKIHAKNCLQPAGRQTGDN